MPHTKSYRARKVDLIPKALEIVDLLKELNPHYTKDTLMFKRPDGRKITERAVNYVYEKYAERKNSEMPGQIGANHSQAFPTKHGKPMQVV